MFDNYLIVCRDHCGNYVIRAEYNGVRYPKITYMFHSLRDAIRQYRRNYGLVYKHLELIEY